MAQAPAPTAIRAALRSLRLRLPAFVGFRVLSWTLSTVVLAPLTAWVTVRLIETTGAPAVSNFAIATFVLSPAGLGATLLGGSLLLATSYAEQAGFIRLAAAAPGGQRTTRVLVEVVRWLPALVRIGLWHVGALMLTLIPVALVVAGLWFGLLGEHDINWYLANRPPEFTGSIVTAGALGLVWGAVAVWIYLRWCFALPVHVFEGLTARASLRRSAAIFAAGRGLVVRRLAAWWVPVVLVSSGFGFAWDALEGRALELAVAVLREPVAAIAVLLALQLATGAVFAFVVASVHAILRLDLYRELTGARTDQAPADEHADQVLARAPSLGPSLKLGAAALLVTTGVVAWFVVDRIRVEHEVLITAHRGSSQRAPENTLAALRAAVEDGADLAEIDVQTTRDGVVVVIHDHDLMRVADMPRKVSELDLAELQALDIGSWFGADFAGEHVPTLREAIQAVRGDTRLLVEIKNDGSDPRLAERVVEVLREENFSDQCLVMSLDLGSVRTVRRLAPDLPVGLIVSQSVGNVLREDLDFVAVRAALATVDYVSRAHALGKDVHAWTVNDAQVASALVDRGVDNLISDVPDHVRAVLAQRAQLEPAERLLLAYRNRRVP